MKRFLKILFKNKKKKTEFSNIYLILKKRAFNLANTPQFVQHVLCNNQNNTGINNNQAIYLSPNQSLNYLTNSNYYNALSLNQDLNLSTSNLYLSKLINDGIQQKQLIEKAASKGRGSNGSEDPLKHDLDQQAQQSILNNEIGRRYEIWFKKV